MFAWKSTIFNRLLPFVCSNVSRCSWASVNRVWISHTQKPRFHARWELLLKEMSTDYIKNISKLITPLLSAVGSLFFYSFYSSDSLFIVLYKCTSSNVQNSIYQIKARVQITINHTKQIEKERAKTTRPTEKKHFHLCIYLFIESHKVEYNTRKKIT